MVAINFNNRPTLVSNNSEVGTPLSYALKYAALGWFVLPVWNVDEHGNCRCGKKGHAEGHRPGKHPHGVLVPQGFNNASNDPEVIREWFTRDPEAGIGIQMSRSGLVALDVDPRNGGDDTLEALESEHGVLYSECEATTQGGGLHRLFRSETGAAGYSKSLGAGLDLIHSTYICVEPTRGESGVYRWAPGHNPLQGATPSTPPSLLQPDTESKYSLIERSGTPVATAQTFEDLRSALEYIDADAYDTWVKVGLALKPYGEAGYAVWVDWSATSGKFSAVDARKKWDRGLSQPDTITYKTIFHMALENKWPGNSAAAQAEKSAVKTMESFTLEPLTLQELKDAQLNPRVILPYFLYADVRTRISAGGTGKTTVALYEAITLALGRELWGRTPEQPVRTAIVTREDTREILVARTREIMRGMGLQLEQVNQVVENLIIVDLSGISFRVSAVVGDVVLPHAGNLAWLIKTLSVFKPDWLVMDPMVSFGVGEQRVNDAEQGLIEAMRILKAEFNCCVEGIHHSGKANAREKTLDQYSGRGGSALSDGSRMVCVMQPLTPQEWADATGAYLSEGESGIVMAMPKMSYCRPQEPIYVKRYGYSFEQVRPLTAPSIDETQRQHDEFVLQAIKDAWFRNQPLSAQELKDDYKALFYNNLKRDAVMEALGRLKRDGLVVQQDNRGGRGHRSHLEPIILTDESTSKYAIPGEPGETQREQPAGF